LSNRDYQNYTKYSNRQILASESHYRSDNDIDAEKCQVQYG
jgi:hypothetical protein